MELRDGSVLQDGLQFTPRQQKPGKVISYIPYPVIGQITKVAAPEDDDNFDQETYLCDVHVTELGIDLFQVPWTLPKAGPDNYVHYGPVAATANLDFTPFNARQLDPKVSNGDTCIVVFAFGSVHKPYIIRILPHNQSGPNGMSPDPRPTAEDGDVYKVRFNGTNVLIDKDGNLTIENTDTLDPLVPRQKVFTINWNNAGGDANVVTIDMTAGNESVAIDHATGSFVHMDPDGSIDMASSEGDEILVSPSEGIQLSTPANDGTSISMKDGQIDIVAGQGVSIEAQGGPFSITVDGDYDITSNNGGVNITADGGDVSVKSSSGGVSVEADGGDVSAVVKGGDFKVAVGDPIVESELLLGGGKFKIKNLTGELVDNLEKEVGAWVDNAATAILTSVGPGAVSPAIVTVLTAVRLFLSSLKA